MLEGPRFVLCTSLLLFGLNRAKPDINVMFVTMIVLHFRFATSNVNYLTSLLIIPLLNKYKAYYPAMTINIQ